MQAIIDLDIVAFRCAASAENEPEDIAILRADKLMRDILYLTDAETYEGYLTGANNFRKEIFPEYKANRKDKPKPVHLPAIRDFLVREWNAIVTDGCEADDMLGVAQYSSYMIRRDFPHLNTGSNYLGDGVSLSIPDETVICSIDKDLLQIPGKHFNFVKAEWYDVSVTQGIRHFYEQLLKGDKTDGIPGVAGLGEKKAARLLEGCETEQELFDVCREQYKNDELLLTYGKCLWIWRYENDIWNPTQLLTGHSQSNSEEELNVESTQETGEETGPFTEPTILSNQAGSQLAGD